jgi:dTDP-4-amino-4,6-dideoxygalactose transaminase
MPSYEEYCEEIKSIWDTVHLTNMGPIHNKLKDKVRDYLGVQNVELFVNGHLALYTALRALRLSGEIITTPFTFASTTNAIVQAGCTPVFCDVKDDYTIDETKIEALINEKTVAILGVHVYGNVCAVEEIQKIADRHGLKVIYDAAHVFGVRYLGEGIGSYGDVSMFSFHATKVFHTIEGGALTFGDPELSEKIAKERNFGVFGESLDCFGTNAKMNEFQAAMGICNLRHIDAELASRRTAYERYFEKLSSLRGITLPKMREGVEKNYAYFPILVDESVFGVGRDTLLARLAENGIIGRKYFYPLTSENKELGADLSDLTPDAKKYSRNVMCLPLFAHLDVSDVDKICNIIVATAAEKESL